MPIIKEDGITGGAVRSAIIALSILRDTRKARRTLINNRFTDLFHLKLGTELDTEL